MSRRHKTYNGIDLEMFYEHFVFKSNTDVQLSLNFSKEAYQDLEDEIQDEDIKFLMRKYQRKYRGKKSNGNESV